MFKGFLFSSFLTFLLACIHVHSAPIPGHLRNALRSIQSRDSQVYTGGNATYYLQNGNAGACGEYNSDSALIAAMDTARYGDTGQVSPLCGQYVKITNINNQKTVTVKIADACPTCNSENSIDLSQGAFTQIATIEEGEVPITWEYVDGDDSSNTDNSSTGDDTDNGSDSDWDSGSDDSDDD
ncbi:RlpA-like double-psi beta-barrel-protein domain-containing protein-containing protein [Lentinula boryana]|uniref:RlpA-like double-psi beta-barrel-protein domain-containing protein-containing protein n=1 Tax=Lentinula boryana TaxID=40481 RepID=A0ABQ8PZT1_9AGAR|nr:RlpA-like double-psi beta-barrel-protein domain-containing protein-containing protein [Lentinula boryana]